MKHQFFSKTVIGSLILLGAFCGLTGAVWDLKHPHSTVETCSLVGQGLSIREWKKDATLLYSNDGRPSRDIGLSCEKKGSLWLNDDLVYAPKKGQTMLLTTIQYHLLPTRHRLALHVLNTNPQEIAEKY